MDVYYLISACSSLAFTSAMSLPAEKQFGTKQHSNNSLVHCLLKLAQKEPPYMGMVFAVLTTLALSQESRGIMCKVGQSSSMYHFHLCLAKPLAKKLC